MESLLFSLGTIPRRVLGNVCEATAERTRGGILCPVFRASLGFLNSWPSWNPPVTILGSIRTWVLWIISKKRSPDIWCLKKWVYLKGEKGPGEKQLAHLKGGGEGSGAGESIWWKWRSIITSKVPYSKLISPCMSPRIFLGCFLLTSVNA